MVRRAAQIEVISRPYYAPHRLLTSLKRSLPQRKRTKPAPSQHAWNFYVRYRNDQGHMDEMCVRDYDSVYFQDPSSQTAIDQLNLILSARAGNDEAQRALRQQVETNRQAFERFNLANLSLGSSRFHVIPCTAEGDFSRLDLGNKGANLMEAYRLGLPVPVFCAIRPLQQFAVNGPTTSHRRRYMTSARRSPGYRRGQGRRQGAVDFLDGVLSDSVSVLEQLTGNKYNDAENPLLFSLRACLPDNLPGMLPTYLNLGATTRAMPGLIARYGEEGASDVRINHLAKLLTETSGYRVGQEIHDLLSPYPDKLEQKMAVVARLVELRRVIRHKAHYDLNFRLRFLFQKAYLDMQAKKDTIAALARRPFVAPIMLLEDMIVGRLETLHGTDSFSGVIYSRDPNYGLSRMIEFALKRFGEEVMTQNALRNELPYLARQVGISLPIMVQHFDPSLDLLERERGGPVSCEVTAERGMMALLQVNQPAQSGIAALNTAWEMLVEGLCKRRHFPGIVQPYHMRQIFADKVVIPEGTVAVAKGTRVIPFGDTTGKLYFSREAALEAKARGEKVVLILHDFLPADAEIMPDMDGLVCLEDFAIHLTEIARRSGIVALVGLEGVEGQASFSDNKLVLRTKSGEVVINEGDGVILSSKTQSLYLGEVPAIPSQLKLVLKGGLPPEDLKGKDDLDLWRRYEQVRDEMEQLTVAEIPDTETLADVCNMLLFMDNRARAIELANEWFSFEARDVLDYYWTTKIGKHAARLSFFDLLELKHKNLLIEMLAKNEANREAGVFVLGRLLIEYKENLGQRPFERLIKGFGGEDEARAMRQVTQAEEYLGFSKVPTESAPKPEVEPAEVSVPSAQPAPKISRFGDRTLEKALRFALGDDAVAAMSAEQVAAYKSAWSAEVDPEHKPSKSIRAIMRKMGKS